MPFLFAVALLFVGLNSIGHLKTYYPQDVKEYTTPDGKRIIDTVYHEVLPFSLKPLGQDSIFCPSDSINFMIGFFYPDSMVENRKQWLYLSELINRYSGITINAVLLGDEANWQNLLVKDDFKLFEEVEALNAFTLPIEALNNVKRKLVPDGKPKGFYTLVDKRRNIRGHFTFNDLKEARDAKDHLKVLDAEFYEIKRKRVVQKRD